MQIEHGDVTELKSRLMKIFRSFPELEGSKFFFFGSRITGQGNDRSDIDVGILGETPVPAAIWLDLQERIEDLPYLYKIDLVDFCRVPPDFRKVALSRIEEIGKL